MGQKKITFIEKNGIPAKRAVKGDATVLDQGPRRIKFLH